MKHKFLMIMTLLLIATNSSMANIATPVSFVKGSDCGSFKGKYKGRNFILALKNDQTITFSINDNPADIMADVIIKNPKGKIEHLADDGTYGTQFDGKYSITFLPKPKHSAYGNISFCAF